MTAMLACLEPWPPDQMGGLAAVTATETAELDLAALYRAHRLALVRLARLLVDDTAAAEDVVQDVFVKLHNKGFILRESTAAMAYLRTAVINNSRSVLRRRQTERRHSSAIDEPKTDGADSAIVLAAEHREVLDAVNQLPQRQREVMVLRYWSELSEAEIASALSISQGAVKSHASRAMNKLEGLLGEKK